MKTNGARGFTTSLRREKTWVVLARETGWFPARAGAECGGTESRRRPDGRDQSFNIIL
jgi:hypothetical protein